MLVPAPLNTPLCPPIDISLVLVDLIVDRILIGSERARERESVCLLERERERDPYTTILIT